MRESDKKWLFDAAESEKRRRHERYDRIQEDHRKLQALNAADSEADR